MFFRALFTTYFFLRARVPEWEPIFQRCAAECEKPHWNSVTPIFGTPVPLVAINTAFLLASSVTMQFAVNAIKKRRSRRVSSRLARSRRSLLGIWFICGQIYEYTKLGFLPDNGIFTAVFFTLTGFHGAHVTGGILMNVLVLIPRARRGTSPRSGTSPSRRHRSTGTSWTSSGSDSSRSSTSSARLDTDQQMSFRSRWSSSTSSRIASGSWSRCHRHSSRPAISLSFRRSSTRGLDRIGGRTELVRRDVRDGRGLAGSVRGMPCRSAQVSRRGVRVAGRAPSLGHRALAAHPRAHLLDRLTRSRVLRLSRLEEVEDVLGARCRPQGEELVIRIGERPTAADRHETRVALLREDHT